MWPCCYNHGRCRKTWLFWIPWFILPRRLYCTIVIYNLLFIISCLFFQIFFCFHWSLFFWLKFVRNSCGHGNRESQRAFQRQKLESSIFRDGRSVISRSLFSLLKFPSVDCFRAWKWPWFCPSFCAVDSQPQTSWSRWKLFIPLCRRRCLWFWRNASQS